MNPWVRAVMEFHQAANLGIRDRPVLFSPASALRSIRRRLIREEHKEYQDAEDLQDLTEIADGLVDIIYVAIGTSLEYGLDIDRLFMAVHRSNMSKAVNGVLESNDVGKILKGPNYVPPNIKGLLELPEITLEERREYARRLHAALDTLLAMWLSEQGHEATLKRPVLELVQWSGRQIADVENPPAPKE